MKKYIEIYQKIKKSIISGAFLPNGKLPSKREIAAAEGASVITAEHALELLQTEGYIESRERKGYFVIYEESDLFSSPEKNSTAATAANKTATKNYAKSPVKNATRSANTEENANLNESERADLSGESESFPFSVYAKKARAVLNDYGERIFIKSPNFGAPELKKALRDYLARNRGIFVDEERIIIGSGAEYFYGVIAKLFKDKVFAIENPSYDKIEKIYLSEGVKIEKLPLSGGGIDSLALKNSSATVLHVTPCSSYPTGATAGAAKKLEYVRRADERDGFVIEDDYQSEFFPSTKPSETVFSFDKSDRVIYMNTFSKTLCPSIRAGYIILPKRLYTIYKEKFGFYSCTVPAFEQFLIAELISDGSFERHVNKVRRMRRKNK